MSFSFSALNYVDYVVITIIAFSTLFAFMRGFIKSFLSFVGWMVSIYLTYLTYPMFKPYIQLKIVNPIALVVVGHSILLLGYLLLVGMFNCVVGSVISSLTAGIIDRFLGACFGVLRGCLIASFFYFIVNISLLVFHGSTKLADLSANSKNLPSWLTSSQTLPLLQEGQGMLVQLVPGDFLERVETLIETTSHTTKQERFIDSITDKLIKVMPQDQKDDLITRVDILRLTKSEKEAQDYELKELINYYKKADADAKGRANLSKDDLDKVAEYIKETDPE
jgi:membrane protein required for colicin V production